MTDRPTLEEVLAKKKKKYLIFDFDSTIFTLDLPWGEYLDHVYDQLKAYNEEFFEENAVNNESNFQLINRFTREFGTEPRDITLEYARRFEVEKLDGGTECPAQLAFLREHKDDYVFFIWTSNCTTSVEPVLKENGFYSMFEKIIGRDSVTYCKPEPDGFSQIKRHVLEHIDANATQEDFMMIGDSNSDEGAAYHANIDFFRV